MLRSAIMMALGALVSATCAEAQTYPARPVNVIVALAAGTGMDTLVRVYTDRLSQSLSQPLVVENRPGSAGLAAGEAIARSAPDGYTLGTFTSAVMAIRPTLIKKMPFSPSNDFVPIALYVKSPFVFIVDPKLPVQSVADFIKYAKERPGKLSYSSSGVGGAPHLTAELIKQKFGLDLAHVPYRNSPQSITDVAAGHVQMAIAEAGASLPLIKDGKLRALAVTSLTRFATIPEVPTLAQATGDAELEAVSWHILVAREGTPAPIAGRLHQEMKRIMATPDVKEKIEAIGLIPHETPSIEGMQRYIKAETDKWGAVVRSLGLEGSE
jgi:tripartite-type tricarboxylate transporter receptor subunit TctC